MFILLVLPKLISLVCTGSPEMVFLVTTKLSGCLFFNSLPFFRIYSRLREKMKMKYVFFFNYHCMNRVNMFSVILTKH